MATTKTTKDLYEASFIEEMKKRLLEEQVQLTEKLDAFARKSPATSENPNGTYPEYGDEAEDNIHEMEEYEVNLSLQNDFEKQLRDVVKALERMENGTYGVCKYTNEKIDEKRLEARPTSSSSTAAKEALQSGGLTK